MRTDQIILSTRRAARHILIALVGVAVAAGTGVLVGPGAATAGGPRGSSHRSYEVAVVSSRPDMISGGGALVRIGLPRFVRPRHVRVSVGGRDVTDDFRPGPDQRTLLGLVDDLALGDNRLHVRTSGRGFGRPRASLTLTNHPAAGPVFSGPHIELFCTADGPPWNLGPVDDDCHVASPTVSYQYRTTAGEWADLPDGPPPDDLATTATTTGDTVPFIVRFERGTINRAVYEIAILHEPGTPVADPWTATPGWNDRLIYTFGGACGIGHTQATSTGGVRNEALLSRGYAVASATFNVYANNCNDVTSAETAMMVKEHIVETYGVPDFTMGWGPSAGTMQQLLIANAYPGILDGVLGDIGYPDERSVTLSGHECRFIFEAAGPAGLTTEQRTAVTGFGSPQTCVGYQFFDNVDWPVVCPDHIPAASRYDPASNPDGIRCAIADFVSNVYGVDQSTGFGRPIIPDTVGVQYGLRAFEEGVITPEQFVALNEGIGGLDIEGNRTTHRTSADPAAIEVGYATGRVNQFDGGLRWTPIIETRGYTDLSGDFHDRFRSWTMRERLLNANGHADNHISITTSPGPAATEAQLQALADMDAWLTARTRLAAARPNLRESTLTRLSRPPGLADACVAPDGERIVEELTLDPAAACNQLYPYHRNPRIVAGGPTSADVLKCQLQPLDQPRFGVTFTHEQRQRLEVVFPDGVCDWSRAGVGQIPLAETWIRF